ncbi:short-chain dehydrogenase [Wenyingzhuangia fucanilytica]|uniref:Short-chain dehydrogenase n=1 Tax=Wenyingzhuangia fucanilytica TaxID=1790137 RepID=A0A1B1Y936_9FLAO|nr:glucose 1-dehydrogenase [Wenyingzhuangia fucanilytica]ANW97291.1 short-chain dehydrogenase [Wenyingzhuangia fucanilytica]
MSVFNLTGKCAVVTGGGSGIGEAISKALAGAGALVNILDLTTEGAQRVADEIIAKGGKAIVHQANVVDHEGVKNIIKKINDNQPINILINNAGIAHVGNVEACGPDDLDKLYNVNIKGVYNALHAVIPFMKENGGGAIVNMASIASSVGLFDRFAYSMTKGAVLTMTYSIAKDYVKDGIRCNCISPARVHTPFVDGFISKNYPGQEAEMFEKLSATQPIGRMAKPEEIGNLALYLVSDEASFLTGTDYPIDGGFIKLNGK